MICFVRKASKINWLILLLFSSHVFAVKSNPLPPDVSITKNSGAIVSARSQYANGNLQKLFPNFPSLYFSSLVVTLSAGPVWESNGKTQTFFLTPEIEKTYTANQSTETLPFGELFLGIQNSLGEEFQGQWGLAIVTTGNANLSGEIWDDADSEFNNYTYKYQVKHTHLALKGKLLFEISCIVMPWISGSAGLGFNEAHSFTNTPTISEAVQNPNFSSNTKTSFTYTVGAGIDYKLTKNWQVGVGYEFADWGKSQLARASGQTLSSGLILNHLYTNGFLLNITYFS